MAVDRSLSLGGIQRSWPFVVLMNILTLGIYGIYWFYQTAKELQSVRPEGYSGGLMIVLLLFTGPVALFLAPANVGHAQRAAGLTPTVSGWTGCWFLLPLAGGLVWIAKMQNAMNAIWTHLGTVQASLSAAQSAAVVERGASEPATVA